MAFIDKVICPQSLFKLVSAHYFSNNSIKKWKKLSSGTIFDFSRRKNKSFFNYRIYSCLKNFTKCNRLFRVIGLQQNYTENNVQSYTDILEEKIVTWPFLWFLRSINIKMLKAQDILKHYSNLIKLCELNSQINDTNATSIIKLYESIEYWCVEKTLKYILRS